MIKLWIFPFRSVCSLGGADSRDSLEPLYQVVHPKSQNQKVVLKEKKQVVPRELLEGGMQVGPEVSRT